MTCRPLAGAQLLTAWNLLWWKQRTVILSAVSEGTLVRQGRDSVPSATRRDASPPKPYAGHLLPLRMDHGPSLLFARTGTPNPQHSCHLCSKCLRTGGLEKPQTSLAPAYIKYQSTRTQPPGQPQTQAKQESVRVPVQKHHKYSPTAKRPLQSFTKSHHRNNLQANNAEQLHSKLCVKLYFRLSHFIMLAPPGLALDSRTPS